AVFRYFRGGRCILSAAGVKLQFRSHTVVCPWSLFNTYGQPHVLPEKEVFLLPVAPAAVRQVVQFKAGHEEPLACGLEVRAPHWKFQSLRQVVLKPIYEVNPEEFA